MAHPDLPVEQAYLDRAYERLEAVRAEIEKTDALTEEPSHG